jgi:exosortase A
LAPFWPNNWGNEVKLDNEPTASINWSIWRRSIICTGLAVFAICLVFLPILLDMIRIWREDTTYNHGFLIAPISLWLVYMRKEELVEISPKPNKYLALLLLIPTLIMVVGQAGSLALLEHFAFVAMLVGVITSILGWPFARKFWFAVLFLFFMVPIGVELVPTLQKMTALASVWLLRLSGIPVFLEGMLIQLPNSLFEVAEACAGIRFLIANIVIAALFSYFCFRKIWKIVLFMALAVTVPIVANFFRAYGIMMIAHYSNNELAVGVDHLVYGWVFFTMVMVVLLWIGSLFADHRWTDPLAFKQKLTFVHASPPSRRELLYTTGVALFFTLSIPLFNAVTFTTSPVLTEPNYPQIVKEGSEWTVNPTDMTSAHHWSPVYKTADRTYRIDFEKNGTIVEVFIAWIGKQKANKEIIHFSNRFDDDVVWKRGTLGTITVPSADAIGLPNPARFDQLTTIYNLEQANLGNKLVASWYWVNGKFTSNAKMAKLYQIQASLTGHSPSAGVIALAAPYETNPEEGLQVLQDFLASMNNAGDIFRNMEATP